MFSYIILTEQKCKLPLKQASPIIVANAPLLLWSIIPYYRDRCVQRALIFELKVWSF